MLKTEALIAYVMFAPTKRHFSLLSDHVEDEPSVGDALAGQFGHAGSQDASKE